jgi:F-type H+-transporting ATPase subunit gamma
LCAAESFELGQSPTTKEAQGIADELYSEFVSEDVDKVSNMMATQWALITPLPS